MFILENIITKPFVGPAEPETFCSRCLIEQSIESVHECDCYQGNATLYLAFFFFKFN